MLLLLFCVAAQTCVAQSDPEINGITGYLGMQALKGNWRPFNNNSPWNTVIPANTEAHLESPSIIDFMGARTVRLAEEWNPTLHVVNAQASKYNYRAWSGTRHGKIYRFTHFTNNWWNPDADNNDITDEAWPYIPGVTYAEDRDDGRMIIVDKSAGNKYTSYEVSHGTSSATLENGYAPCTTFNIWGLGSRGIVADRTACSGAAGQGVVCDDYWFCAGGHGAGTSLIAGLIRPKELTNAVGAVLAPTDPNYSPDVPSGDGLIHHALKFAFNFNRCGPPLYPFAYRNDGPILSQTYSCIDKSKPVEGMLFQLRANFDESTINNVYGKVIVRTLKTYGMVLVDNGSNDDTMALYIQNMCTPGGQTNKQWWEDPNAVPCFRGMYDSIANKIYATDFHVVDTVGMHGARLLQDHSACPQSHCHPDY